MIFAISFLHQNSHRITFGIYHKHVPPPSKAVLMEAASALISPWLVVFRETTYQTCSRRDALSPQRHDPMPTRTTLAGLGVVRDRLLCSFFSQDMWRYDPRTDRPDSGSYVILHKYLLRSHVKLRTTIKHITDLGVVRGYIMPSEPFSYPFSFLSGVTWRHDPSIDTHDLQTEVSQVREEGGGRWRQVFSFTRNSFPLNDTFIVFSIFFLSFRRHVATFSSRPFSAFPLSYVFACFDFHLTFNQTRIITHVILHSFHAHISVSNTCTLKLTPLIPTTY